ncbi:hypothetical protein AGMMS49983_21070 [Clostridia bacterium]|nr:hypothetical protein AGMMS49983_21070 [Clostridia bacterium]
MLQQKEGTDMLVDFKGKPIKLHKTGLRYPVDAVLTEEKGFNQTVR